MRSWAFLFLATLLLYGGAVAPAAAQQAYVPNFLDNTVSVIDTGTHTVTATVPVGSHPIGAAVAPNGSHAYVVNFGDGTVSVIDTATNTVTATITLGSAGLHYPAVTPDSSTVYVADDANNQVVQIDAATNTVGARIAVGNGPGGIVMLPAQNALVVANFSSGTLSFVDIPSASTRFNLPVGNGPVDLALSPDGLALYVANFTDNTVAVVDADAKIVTATITGFNQPNAVAMSPDGDTVYVTNDGNATVSAISTATNTVTATIPVGTSPSGAAITQDGSALYVLNEGSNTVSVIDTATKTVTTINTGREPNGFGAFIQNPPPTVTAVNPTAGPTAGGTTVTIAGTNFFGATAVSFGGTPATAFTVDSNTQVTATAPSGTAGTVDVTVTTPRATSPSNAGDHYLYDAPPSIAAAFTPTTVTVGTGGSPASTLTFTLSNPNSGTALSGVAFSNSLPAGLAVATPSGLTNSCGGSPSASGGSITLTGGSISGGGACTIAVNVAASTTGLFIDTTSAITSTEGGTGGTGSASLTANQALPIVSALNPANGPIGGGTSVVITGSNLTGATAVAFGSTAATGYTVNSATQITATAPAGSIGTVDVTVTTSGGTSATGAADHYTYVAAPTVSTLNPTSGPTAGGTSVIITGTNLSGATAVSFGGTAASGFTVNSATQITATAPAGTAGTVDVKVTTIGGTSATGAGDRYTYVAAPTLSALSPASGPTNGRNTVIITGGNFTGATAVAFGDAAATYTVNSATQITATAPAGSAGAVDVTVTTVGGTSAIGAADRYSYVAAPAVSAVSPAAGPTAGGGSVTITGTNLTGATSVSFGGVAAAGYTVSSASQIIATVPPDTAGTVDITVATAGGTSVATAADHYTFVAPPTVSALSPASGPTAGGTPVTIIGSNLTGATAVSFGATAASSFAVNSATQITATAPPGTAGTVDVIVTTVGGTSAAGAGDRYAYIGPPSVSSISPASGAPAGGTSVAITGSNLAGATSVSFGTIQAARFTVDSASQVTAISPAGSGTVDITVTTASGTSTAIAGDLFSYASAQTSVAVSSSANPSPFGTAVTFTASVTAQGGSVTGTVTFSDGTTVLGTLTLAASQASFTAPVLSAGTHEITARFLGNTNFAPSASSPLAQTVQPAGAPVAGQAYTFQTTLGVTGVAGDDNGHFGTPMPGAVDTINGHLLVADPTWHRVQVIDTTSLAVVATLGVAGVAGSDDTHLNQPGGVGFDPVDNRILVADTGNQRIQIYDAKSLSYLLTLGVTGVAGADNSHFDQPSSAHLDAGRHLLYVADRGNHRVQLFDAGTLAYAATLGIAGNPGHDDAHLDQPQDAELDPITGQIMVADTGNGRVQLFDASSFVYAGTIGGDAPSPGQNSYFGAPVTAAFDPTTNLVLIADAGLVADDRVQAFDGLSYSYILTLGTTGTPGAGTGQFAGPGGIAIDATHARLFVGDAGNHRVEIFSVAPPTLFASVLPTSRSVRTGTAATIFASMVNAGPEALQNCRIQLPANAPPGLSLGYQTTEAGTNALTGAAGTPATIAGGNGTQSFLIAFQDSATLTEAEMPLDFACDGAAPAPIMPGVDTPDLIYAATPVPDVIAIAATPAGNGILTVPFSRGQAAPFVVATDNLGAAGSLTAEPDFNGAALPLTVTICQTDPTTGVCLLPPSRVVTTTIAAGSTPTFALFATASAPIPLAPASARIFVRFRDGAGIERGATSVAVQTD